MSGDPLLQPSLGSRQALLPATGRLPPPVTARKDPLPIFPGFGREVLPALAGLWAVMLALFFALDEKYFLAIGLVATPTVAMLWPVGRSLGYRYLDYRRPAWLFFILTMWIIPTTGLVLTQTGWDFTTKSVIFFALPAIIAFGGILVALPWAQAKRPVRMFFRPDLLFGDGRTLVGGTLMLVVGMRYLFAGHPPGVQWALPTWNWYSLAWGIGLSIIPIVLMRGMVKLVQRLMRLRDRMFSGYPSLAFREWILLFFALNFGWAFHHVFMGRTVFSTIGEPGQFPTTSRFWIGIGIMAAAAWWMLIVKGGFKKLIGEPFFFESSIQTLQKQLVFTIGWAAFFYGYISMLAAGMFGRIQPWGDQTAAGLGFFLTGILVLTFGRTVAQHYQRQGMLAHFAGAIIPTQPDRARERMMRTLLEGMARLSARRQERAWLTMHRAWARIDPDEHSLMTWTTVNALAELDEWQRVQLSESQRRALDRLDDAERARATRELARSVAALDADKTETAQLLASDLPGEPRSATNLTN
jgi:hypothetical protein